MNFARLKGWKRSEDLLAYLQQQPPPEEGIDCRAFHCDLFPNAARALAKMVRIDRDERYRSVEQVLDDLGAPVELETPKPAPRSPMPPMPPMPPMLVVESGSNQGARIIVKAGESGAQVIGRVDIAASDQSLSREHLEISHDGEDFYARDLGSKNGTFMMGLPVLREPPTLLRHNDLIKAGDVLLRFVMEKDF